MKVGVFCMDNIERMWAAYNLNEVGGWWLFVVVVQ